MSRFRNYWIYSAALAVVWAILLILVFALRGPARRANFSVDLHRLLPRLGEHNDRAIHLPVAQALGRGPKPRLMWRRTAA